MLIILSASPMVSNVAELLEGVSLKNYHVVDVMTVY
jgi:hypothetical protein